jgi:molecular chaperone GrpE
MNDRHSPDHPAGRQDAEKPADAAAPVAVDPLDAAAQEAADLKDKLLRALAEMENLRRRTEREVADARLYGIASFARDILGVADNMDRALQALDTDLREKADATTKALLDGVELTERELLKVLEKHGVKKFEPLGEKFDPNLHQAMFELPDPSRPAGTVAQVMQPGYMIGERMLRPALVAVAKGEPKAMAEAPANDNAGSASQDPQRSA